MKNALHPSKPLKTKIAYRSARRGGHGSWTGFTLIELMISMTFLVVLMLVVSNMVSVIQRTWVRANSRVSVFREARMAFDRMSKTLAQATLNPYWESAVDILAPDSLAQERTRAKRYVRQSELQFVCGPSGQIMQTPGGAVNYPGHAVFFQAPLGVTNLVAATGAAVNTENMVNLLCGRGYFVVWGDDAAFRPPFLAGVGTVPTRSRFRLMEYSPTAEMNRIYDSTRRPLIDFSRLWYEDAASSVVVAAGETAASRAFTRPIAENIIALIISPQTEVKGNVGAQPYAIAPNYIYDSLLEANPGAAMPTNVDDQGTQHLLPPLIKLTMVAVDEIGGEKLSSDDSLRNSLLTACGSLFNSAANFESDISGTGNTPGTLETFLLNNKLNYRVFTATIPMKQSRWSRATGTNVGL
jgi:uncharacterized protein (TIGR02599 family)